MIITSKKTIQDRALFKDGNKVQVKLYTVDKIMTSFITLCPP